MTDAIAVYDHDQLPAGFREPNLTPQVAAAVAHYLAPDPHAGPRVRLLPDFLRQRAANFVAEAEASSGPAPARVVGRWLMTVSAGVGNAPHPDEFGAKVSAVALACSDLPGWGFSSETAHLALRTFKFFPSAAEVHDLIAEATKKHRDTIRALKALAEAERPPVDAEGRPKSPEERAAVGAGLCALREELDAKARAAEARNPGAVPIKANVPRPEVLAVIRDANPVIQAARKAAV